MKRSIVVLIIVLMVIVSAAIATIKTTEDIEPISYASVTIGDIRVTLVSISRTVSLTNQYVQGRNGQEGQLYAVPSVYVECLIERLGDTPTKTGPHEGGIEFWENGKKILDIGSIVGGGVGVTKQYQPVEDMFGFDMPSVDNPDRTRVRTCSERGVVFSSKRIDIRIRTGFDENELQWFIFENIPIY